MEIKKKKALLLRFGGIGDMAPMMVVGEQLKRRGFEVHCALREDGPNMRLSDLLVGNQCFDKVLDWRQMGPWGNRCIKTQIGWVTINSVYPDYDLILDYMFAIEANSTSPYKLTGPGNNWMESRNSNWVNWYDLHLAWANIDPTSVAPEEKRPTFVVSTDEREAIRKVRDKFSHFVVIQTSASSLSRTWYQGKQLPDMIIKRFPQAAVAFWDSSINTWVMFSKFGGTRLDIPGASPLRASMALISVSDLFIGSDSGYTHIAEGLGVKNIAIYSTVPAWTRAKYYQHQTAIDPGKDHPEFYTFNLGLGDPLRTLEGQDSFTEREKLIDKMYKQKAKAEQAAEALNTDLEGAELELKALEAKKASFERQQSKALSSVKPEMVFEVAEKILKRVK